jgi:hypothetical protein
MIKFLDHKEMGVYNSLYGTDKKGLVYKSDYSPVTIHKNKFVRLSSQGITRSVMIGRLVLFCHKPNEYFEGAIAVSINGNPTDFRLENLKWGTRSEQSKIAMKNPDKFKLVRDMGIRNRDNYKVNFKSRWDRNKNN